MTDDRQSVTLLRRLSGASSRRTPSLPADILDQVVKRLGVMALVFAFVFFMADFAVPILNMLGTEIFGPQYDSPGDWLPGVLSIGMALAVFGLCTWSRLSAASLIVVGLAFEVVGSYGIAFAQFWAVYEGLEYEMAHLEIAGPSWVAVWIVLFAVVVPTSPRRALAAALASSTSVPVVILLTMRYGGTSLTFTTSQFFFAMVFPYLLVTIMAYVGARVVYRLGTDVRKARELGSYRLEELLGEGGMGEVWRARHRMLARPAAIKLVRPEVLHGAGAGAGHGGGGRTILQRFEHEAQATASMHSPNTIELYDFGVSSEGAFYYVMELLDGFDLETLVTRFGPVPVGRAVRFLRQACHSLAEAHGHGLIHRDVKPANIYACRYGRDVDFVKVLDFGLVKSRVPDRSQVRLTADNVIGGTPAYMSPEQAFGDQALDGRSDIYALGCVGYWLVTGQLVFEGETPLGTIVMHTQEVPVPPSQRTELPVPADFEEIILRCLAKDRGDRPKTADQLATDLAACGSVSAWTAEQAHEWWEHHSPESSERPVFTRNT